HAHAKIKKIDTSKAEKVTGVHAIIVGDSLPLTGTDIKDRPILAYKKVRYFGEPIAAVVAEHPYIAKQAAALIEVTYEPLPVINTPEEAMKPEATVRHEHSPPYQKTASECPEANTNNASRDKVRKGQTQKALLQSHITIEEHYILPPSDHPAIET